MSIPIVQTLRFAEEYALRCSTDLPLATVSTAYIGACVDQVLPLCYRDRVDMVYQLVRATGSPDEILISVDQLKYWQLLPIMNEDLQHIDDHKQFITMNQFRYAEVHQPGSPDLLEWIDAVYAGHRLVEAQFRIKAVQEARDSALGTLAQLTLESEYHELFSEDESSEVLGEPQFELDYFVI